MPGVLGERMLGGGDVGAAGALVLAGAVDAVQTAVATAYPRRYAAERRGVWQGACSRPGLKSAVHVCRVVDGVVLLDAALLASAPKL